MSITNTKSPSSSKTLSLHRETVRSLKVQSGVATGGGYGLGAAPPVGSQTVWGGPSHVQQ